MLKHNERAVLSAGPGEGAGSGASATAVDLRLAGADATANAGPIYADATTPTVDAATAATSAVAAQCRPSIGQLLAITPTTRNDYGRYTPGLYNVCCTSDRVEEVGYFYSKADFEHESASSGHSQDTLNSKPHTSTGLFKPMVRRILYSKRSTSFLKVARSRTGRSVPTTFT